MGDDDVLEPRTVPAWLEAGVSGLPRARSWDAVVTVDVPQLRDTPLTRVSFQVIASGDIEIVGTEGAAGVADEPLSILVAHATASLPPPLEARAVRTGNGQWSIASRTTKRELADIDLPPDVDIVTVARAPDGDLTVQVDGELVIDFAGTLAAIVTSIIERAEADHDAFVATLERFSSTSISLSVDPL